MASRFKAHRFSAILVLIAAGLWVGTGKFASVGSEEAHAAQPAPGEKGGDEPASAEAPATPMRTVAAIVALLVAPFVAAQQARPSFHQASVRAEQAGRLARAGAD